MGEPNPILFIFAQCLLLASIAEKPSPYRWMFFPAIVCISTYLLFVSGNSEELSMLILGASDYIILTDVQHELRLVNQQGPISDKSLWSRIKWSAYLMVGMRGIGWAHEPTFALPPRPKLTRGQFLVSRILWLAFFVLLFDAGEIAVRTNASFTKSTVSLDQHDALWRAWCTLLFAITSVSLLSIMFNVLPSIVCVATGLSEPESWPHLFGSLSDAYTLRKFWSRTWHQVLRRKFSSHGKYLAHTILRLKPGSYLSSYIQLYVAFIISGLVHTPSASDSGPLRFFLLQALGITFENVAIALGKRIGLGKYERLISWLGYAWVWCWFVYTIPPIFESMLHNDTFDKAPNFSIILGLYRGEWVPTR